jgi:prophage antirepressor-like protein
MNELQIFENADFGKIRMVEIDGKPYAVGVDVARALEYASPSKAVIDHCKGITKLGIPSKGGVQETNVIPEGDIIRLITKAADQSKNENIHAVVAQMEERG